MKIGYMRVSTDEQNLGLQREALEKAGCDQIFEDRGVSGAVAVRAGLTKALAAVGPGDTLVVWKLDRLGRSLGSLTEKLAADGVGFQSLTDSIDTTTAGGKLFFHLMGALAEFERSLISERTKAGLQSARRRGVPLGRPVKLTLAKREHAYQMISEGKETVAGMAALLGVDRVTVYRGLKQRSNQGIT